MWFGVVLCDVRDCEMGEACDGLGWLSCGPSFGIGECGGNGPGDVGVLGEGVVVVVFVVVVCLCCAPYAC